MINLDVPHLSVTDALKEAVDTIPIPGSPPRLSRDGAAVGLSFLDAALRQNHVRRQTHRLSLVDHRSARCAIEVDISLGMLDEEQIQAGELYQRIRRRTGNDFRYPVGRGTDGARDDGVVPSSNVLWVPVSLARRGHAPIDVTDGNGTKIPRLTQFEASRLLASAMYRLFRLILSGHEDATGETTDLYAFLHRKDRPRWLLQAALITLLTERNKPAISAPRPESQDNNVRGEVHKLLNRHQGYLRDYFELLDLAVNEYLLVVALDPRRDEHLLAYDSPLHLERRPRRNVLSALRLSNGPYWVQYRTRLPANLRAFHLVAQTEDSLEVDTMSLQSEVADASFRTLQKDLLTLARQLDERNADPRSRTGQDPCLDRRIELELQGCLQRLSEMLRRRRWDASQAGLVLAERGLASAALAHASIASDQPRDAAGSAPAGLPPDVTAGKLRRAAGEIEKRQFARGLSVETDPPSSRAHVYWRRDPSRTDLGRTTAVIADIFVRDSSGARASSITLFVFAVVGMSYVVGCFMHGLWPFESIYQLPWDLPHLDVRSTGGLADVGGIIAVLLLVPGFLFTRLKLPPRESIAGQLRRFPRLVAHLTIATTALYALALAATAEEQIVQTALAVNLLVPLVLQPGFVM